MRSLGVLLTRPDFVVRKPDFAYLRSVLRLRRHLRAAPLKDRSGSSRISPSAPSERPSTSLSKSGGQCWGRESGLSRRAECFRPKRASGVALVKLSRCDRIDLLFGFLAPCWEPLPE